MEAIVVAVLALIIIAVAANVAPRLNLPSPLLLLAAGVAVGLLPFVPTVEIEPEWILSGILPPLLYSSAVSMPTMNFRREFTAISILATVLVIVTSVLLGLVFVHLIPGLSLAWGIALGAIISPTDPVATGIVKKACLSPRVVTMLEGEGLLNDASALVMLRVAIVATAATFTLWGAAGAFAWSIAAATGIGIVVGRLNLIVRRNTSDATVNTIVSFTVPFLAALPAEAVGASGLVAAVVAGLVTGRRAPRMLAPLHRLSDQQNWQTVELVLEGVIFLTMGLQLFGIIEGVRDEHGDVSGAVGWAVIALVLVLAIRAACVAPLLRASARKTRRGLAAKDRIDEIQRRLEEDPGSLPPGRRPTSETERNRFGTRLRRIAADIEYFADTPLDWRDGFIVIWAGMRGAVTVAAAQTLPVDTPQRDLLILIAFVVAAASLMIQGGSLYWVVSAVKPTTTDLDAQQQERARLLGVLRDAAGRVPYPADDSPQALAAYREARIPQIRQQRDVLLDARDDGTFSADALGAALIELDAEELTLGLKARNSA